MPNTSQDQHKRQKSLSLLLLISLRPNLHLNKSCSTKLNCVTNEAPSWVYIQVCWLVIAQNKHWADLTTLTGPT